MTRNAAARAAGTRRCCLLAFAALTAPSACADAAAAAATAIVADPCSPLVVGGHAIGPTEPRARDWADLCHFRAANAELIAGTVRPRVVLIGDSITQTWQESDRALFTAGVVGRGISGQTTPQLLVRFTADVVALRPQAVHILAGINDLAGNTGPETEQDYRNNIGAMIDLAQAHGIKVLLASLLPADRVAWAAGVAPAQQIRAFNRWLAEVARSRGATYVDYYAAMATPSGAMRAELSDDGLHPNARGYAVMRPILRDALAALAKPAGEK